ncbi:MAG: hypothetical protein HC854_03315 [Flavobacterium sp.]|nr:hypothetical protein [Flavobacterium sp.]
MGRFFLVILLIGFFYTCNSQKLEGISSKKFKLNPWENNNGYRYSLGYFKDLELGVSYIISSYPQKDPGYGGFALLVQNIGGGLEYLRIGNKNAFGARISYEVSFSLLTAQIASDYIFTDISNQVRLMPKLGISLFSLINLYYGWNKNLLNQNDLKTSEHIISLEINLYDFLKS